MFGLRLWEPILSRIGRDVPLERLGVLGEADVPQEHLGEADVPLERLGGR